jgi:hypothetical protein
MHLNIGQMKLIREPWRLCATLRLCVKPSFAISLIILISHALFAQHPIIGPLKPSKNPNYFADANGKIVYLTGSHTWNTFQDWGTNGSIHPIDFSRFVKMLVQHNHNFTLLWTTELPKFHALPTTDSFPPDFTVSPFPWQRTGPGQATDGGLKFDLKKFNPDYFKRLHQRVEQLDAAGIYTGVYLFTGEWLRGFRCPQDGYPFSGPNNINGVDDGGGIHSVTMTAPNAITAMQDAYVEKIIRTLADMPNVLWIVSEEAPKESMWWNNHLISFIKTKEAAMKLHHPVGLAVLGDNLDSVIYNSDADWLSPAARISPVTTESKGHPKRKVNINDSDHSYWEIWKDSPRANRNYFWINFTQGNQTLFMDPYLVYYPRQKRNLPLHPINGIAEEPDPRWESVRKTMGYIRDFADMMDLVSMTPHGELSSTAHVLASTKTAHPEFLVYAPSGGEFTVNLSAVKSSQLMKVEWFNPSTGERIKQKSIRGGSSIQSFRAPFAGDAVLHLMSEP